MIATITYRKTKTGEWVAFGRATDITPGITVNVTKRSGETKAEQIQAIGRPFLVDGHLMVYGYLTPTTRQPSRQATAPTRRYSNNHSCEHCQYVEDAGDGNGCPRHRGNPRN